MEENEIIFIIYSYLNSATCMDDLHHRKIFKTTCRGWDIFKRTPKVNENIELFCIRI